MLDREKFDRNVSSDPELYLLIRDAAATYGEPASNSNLAQRILSRVHSESTETSRRRWLPWAATLPIAASLVIALAFLAPKPKHTSASQSEQAHISTQPSDRVGSTVATRPFETAQTSRIGSRPRANVRRTVAAANTQSLPKLDTFPAPQALTPNEQAFATYVAHATEEEQRALIEVHDHLEAPLTIAAIKIQPLEPPEPIGH